MEIFAISGLINGLLSLSFGFFIILHNWRAKINQLYFLLVLVVSLWALSYWRWLSSSIEGSALFWVKMLSIGSTLIPPLYFQWIVYFLGLQKKHKKGIILSYLLAAIFLILLFSEFFVKGVRQKLFFSFWPDPGIAYHFYLFFSYIGISLYSFFLLFKNYRLSIKEKRGQVVYILAGSVVALGGGLTNFFLWYDIPIPPYGNFLVALFPFLFGYAIFKHRLFNFRIITTELFTFAIWAVLLVKIIFSLNILRDFLFNVAIFILVIFFGILLIRSVTKEVKQREKMEEMAKRVQQAYETEKRAHEVEKQARKELERLDKAKDQFLLATQHHMRTPLTSTRGFISLLLEGSFGKLTPKARKALKTSYDSLVRLMKLVNELLDVSQFQLGKEVVRIEPNVKVAPILKEIVEELSFEVKERGIYLKLNKPKRDLPPIKADPQRLKVALTNLVDNGIKYTKQGGVTINTEVTDSHILIIVQDTGMGIPKEEFPFLFTRTFERSEAAKKAYGPGRGIGLYLTAQIIKAHQGRIWAESEGRGKGSTFYVELSVG